MSKKLNIILDLDECLLHSITDSVKEDNYKNFPHYKKILQEKEFDPQMFKFKYVVNWIKKLNYYSLTFIRPHLQTLITYLFKHYNVSVWSNGYYTYVDKICDIIFTKSQRKQLKIIFGCRGILNNNNFVYDIKNKKKVYKFEKHNNWIKDLSHLFNNKPYSTIFNKDNTILIDNSIEHLKYNKNNVLNVKDWLFYEQDDTTLLKIIDFLKSPNIKTNKLPILSNFKKKKSKTKSKTKRTRSKIKTKSKKIKKGGSFSDNKYYPIPKINIAPRDGFDLKTLLIDSGVGLPPVINI